MVLLACSGSLKITTNTNMFKLCLAQQCHTSPQIRISISCKTTVEYIRAITLWTIYPEKVSKKRVFLYSNNFLFVYFLMCNLWIDFFKHLLYFLHIILNYLIICLFSIDIKILASPTISPDLNIIENVWAETKRDWPALANRTKDGIVEQFTERWNGLYERPGRINYIHTYIHTLILIHLLFFYQHLFFSFIDYFQNLYSSLHQRYQAVIDNDGHATKY